MVDFRPPAFLSPSYTPSSLSLTMPPVSPALSAFSTRGGSDWGGVGDEQGDGDLGGASVSTTVAGDRDRRRLSLARPNTKQGPLGRRAGSSAGGGQAGAKADPVPPTPASVSSLSSPRSSSGGQGTREANTSLAREGSWTLEDGHG